MTQTKNKRKRIAIFISSMLGGGAQRGILKVARGIADRGHAVDLVLAKAIGPYLSEVPAHVNIVDLKAFSVSTSIPALVRYMRQQQPDAMISALNYVNVTAIIARRLARGRFPLIVNEQNTASISMHKFLRRRGRLFVPLLVKRFYPWADAMVGVSKGVSADLAGYLGLPTNAVHVIHNPIITPEMQEKAHATLDHPWFAPDQPPVVLGVGRLQQQKDFPNLLRAFAEVRSRRTARLLILGEGPDRAMLEKQVAELGIGADVGLPGFDINPYAYMARAGAFVLSSRWEGLPSVLIEALYCGAPLVSTDCPSGPQEILEGGAYGRLVPVSDSHALANGIEAALAGQVARPPAHSWRPYQIDTVVDDYLQLLAW